MAYLSRPRIVTKGSSLKGRIERVNERIFKGATGRHFRNSPCPLIESSWLLTLVCFPEKDSFQAFPGFSSKSQTFKIPVSGFPPVFPGKSRNSESSL